MSHPNIAPLVDCQTLQGLLGDPRVLVVDCRHELMNPAAGRIAFTAGHIPGAVFASADEHLAAPRRADTGRHPLPSPAAFAAALGSWGFAADSRVVAYDQGNGAFAARLWWLLRARGHAAVQVLDGGYAAWLATGGSTETTIRQPRHTTVAAVDFQGFLTTAEVAAGLAARTITLVDARAADRFAGQNETIDPVAGHVPGAVNLPFTENLTATLQFKDAAALRKRWAPLLHAAEKAPLVAMCGSGITACHNLLALELMGERNARLYAGSYSEWISDPSRPVATGEAAL